MFIVLRLISTLISIYMVIIIIRIVLTWFSGMAYHGKPIEFLFRITDPYLDFFRRLRWLRFGSIDFSPVAAILALSILANVLNAVAVIGIVTVGVVLAIIVSALASAVGFFLILFLVLTVIRLVGFLANANTANRFWLTLDHIIEPAVYRFTQMLMRGRTVTYQNGLLIFGGLMFVIVVVGDLLIRQLERLLLQLPF
ncbi:MAG TPA: YggT family protein [Spirochaetia bacterium]|nr:YggT family protein [Spirochaetia bacterium]